ncbi:HEAT repeat domain-containing protein [Nocardiopsis nanhaiensis]
MSPTAPTFGSAAELLASLEDLSLHSRTHALTGYARTHTGTPHLTAILRGLAAAGHHHEALHAAIAARDLGTVAGYLSGPDLDLRRAALRAVRTLPVPGAAVAPLLDDAPTGLRRALYRTLFHGRRAALADALLERVLHRHGDAEAAALLPACAPETVRCRLADLAHAVRSWRRLARRHPDTVADLLTEHVTDRFAVNDWRRALEALDPVRPARVAEIAGAGALAGTHLRCPRARRLAHPDRVVTKHPDVPVGRPLERQLRFAMRKRSGAVRCVLRSMPREVAEPLLDREVEYWTRSRNPETVLPFLDLLPRDRAVSLARGALAELSVFQRTGSRPRDPDQDLDAIAHLPYAEAGGPLGEAASCGDPARRARGLARLVEAAARTGDPAVPAAVLAERVERHRADRDAVRRALLLTLTDLGPRPLVRSLPVLHRLLADTAQARDTSAATRGALRHLAARFLSHPETRAHGPAVDWGIEVYRRLIERFGAEGLGDPDRARHSAPWTTRLGGRRVLPWWMPESHSGHRHGPEPRLYQLLPPGAESVLFGRLSDFLTGACRRGDHGPAVALAGELGRRSRHPTALDGLLRAAVLADPDPGTVARAAALYLAGPDRAGRALSLFEDEPHTARIPRVWDLLVRYQPPAVLLRALDVVGSCQDEPVWVPRALRTRVLPSARIWPPELRERLRAHLTAVVEEPSVPAADREAAVRSLGALPGGHAYLAGHLVGGDVVLREAALSALGRSDDPEHALELITEHSSGPRSRAVGPALSRCAERVRPSRLGPLLSGVLEGAGKVAVRRAAARLLARHRPPEAVSALARALRRDEHRDVLAAAATALLRCADDPEARSALAERAPDFVEEEIQVALLGVDPAELAPDLRGGVAETLTALPAPARSHWRMGGWWARWAVWGSETVDDVFEAVLDLDRSCDRVMATFRLTLNRGRGLDRLDETLDGLLARIPGPEQGVPHPGRGPSSEKSRGQRPVPVEVDHQRACTARNRMVRVLDILDEAQRRAPAGDAVVREQSDRSLALLTARPELVRYALNTVGGQLTRSVRLSEGEPDPGQVVDRLLLAARLLAARPHVGVRWLDRAVGPLCSRYGRAKVGPEVLTVVARRLLTAAEDDGGPVGLYAGLIALSLVEKAARESAWADPWPDLLTDAGRSRHEEIRLSAWSTALG